MSKACCGGHGCHDHGPAQPVTLEAPPPKGGRSFRVYGLDCAEEVALLRAEVGPLVGGADHLAFDLLEGRMVVSAPGIDAAEIIAAVGRAGLSARRWEEVDPAADPDARRRVVQALLAAASAGATGLGLLFEQIEAPALAVPGAFALAIAVGLGLVLPKAWLAARRLRPDINLLMSVAVLGAVSLGDWAEAATVSFLFALSLALEGWSTGRARRAVAALLDLAPPVARIKGVDGTETELPPDRVAVGSVFVVRPGERIPLDGRVVAGRSTVNQAPITGESVPVTKEPGAELFAGSFNGDGALEAETLCPAAESTLARVARLVREAQTQRSPTERWVDRFAAIYTPVVMGLAVLVMVVPPLLIGGEWSEWVYRALVLLVIACPCALVISTPVTMVSAMAAAARAGVLVKGGDHLETPAALRLIAFDKTGTLTRGRPAVERVVALGGHDEAELLARAAALEALSPHPIARAIVRHATERGIAVAAAADIQVLPGRGVVGTLEGREIWLGSHRLLEERGQETPEEHALAEALEADGFTVVVVGSDRHVCGMLALADEIRPEAAAALADLRSAGIGHVALLTGDNQKTAERVAARLGIDTVRAELLPEDKVAALDDLVARFGVVAMVGDGINDAPAMARARLVGGIGRNCTGGLLFGALAKTNQFAIGPAP